MSVAWYEILLRTFVIYFVVLLLLRLAGKRELGQMTPFDLVVILVIANAVQNAMTGGDNSLAGGIIAASTLTAVNIAVGQTTSANGSSNSSASSTTTHAISILTPGRFLRSMAE